MGLFDKLRDAVSDAVAKSVDEGVKDGVSKSELGNALSDFADALKDAAEKAQQAEGVNAAKPADQSAAAPEPVNNYSDNDEDVPDGPSGFSWGPKMPAEENQYNYNGNYIEYFDHIFKDDFPEYTFNRESCYHGKANVYTLYKGENKAAVVEVMLRNCEAKSLRRKCREAGIPYRRFYVDYEGWWNTREYVVKRVRDAIAGIE